MYLDALGWLQDSWLGHAVRSGGFTYAAINSAHVLGAALLLGAIAVFDLLVLKGRGSAAAAAATAAIPLAALGLAIQLPTGIALLAADARATGTNPVFLAKLALIALGVANVALVHARFRHVLLTSRDLAPLRPFAAVSLVAWTLALIAGRMIAYV
jgi:hypothetical protein